MKTVHWLNMHPNPSGADLYALSMWAADKENRSIAFTTHPKGATFIHRGKQGREVDQAISWEEAKKADVHMMHIHMPPIINELKNKVSFMHGTPHYNLTSQERMSTTARFLQEADLVLTSWPSHVSYWQQLTIKPVLYNRPGVDLDFFTPEGPRTTDGREVHRPYILWCDTWKDDKEPWNLLYALAIVKKSLPEVTLKMINVGSNLPESIAKREMLNYMIGRLELDSVVEFPIEDKAADIRPYYRAADFVFCAGGYEGNNVAWEAAACGANIIYNDDIEEIASEIGFNYDNEEGNHQGSIYDIKHTVAQQNEIFKEHFKLE